VDKLQELLDAARIILMPDQYTRENRNTAMAAYVELKFALASGEVVVTTWHDHGDFCSARDGITCLHSRNLNAKCTRTNCPRLPHA